MRAWRIFRNLTELLLQPELLFRNSILSLSFVHNHSLMISKKESNFEKFSTKASTNQKASSKNKIENSPDHYNKCCRNIITDKIKTNLTRENKLSFNACKFATRTVTVLHHISLKLFDCKNRRNSGLIVSKYPVSAPKNVDVLILECPSNFGKLTLKFVLR